MSGRKSMYNTVPAWRRALKAACASLLAAAVVIGAESTMRAQGNDVLAVPSEEYGSLSEAVAAASEGGTILIEPGVYEEPDGLEISKSLTIMGVDRKKPAELRIPDLALMGNGKSWTLANLSVFVENGLVVAGGNSDSSRNSFSAQDCRFVTSSGPYPFAIRFYGDLTELATVYYGDLVIEGSELSGFLGLQVGGFHPLQISDIGSLRLVRSSFDGVYVGLNLANATYLHAPRVAHSEIIGEIGMFVGRGQYHRMLVEHNDFVAHDGGLPPTPQGIAGIIVDEDHSGENPDGQVRKSVFQANRVRGAGEFAIIVDDADGNIFRGNNLNDFEPLVVRVIFMEETSRNYYSGNPNWVSDYGQDNIISGR